MELTQDMIANNSILYTLDINPTNPNDYTMYASSTKNGEIAYVSSDGNDPKTQANAAGQHINSIILGSNMNGYIKKVSYYPKYFDAATVKYLTES